MISKYIIITNLNKIDECQREVTSRELDFVIEKTIKSGYSLNEIKVMPSFDAIADLYWIERYNDEILGR